MTTLASRPRRAGTHRLLPFAAALALGAGLAGSAAAEPARYEIDPAHFSIVFNVDHAGFADTWGMFLTAGGSFTFDEATKELSDLVVTVDTSSVFTNHEGRDGHLRAEDFLFVEQHPEARFVMTGAEATTDTTGTVTGDLTLRGVTKPVTLDVTLNKSDKYPFGDYHAIGISATTTIKRSDFGMTYLVDSGLVGDEVPLTFELEAKRIDDPA